MDSTLRHDASLLPRREDGLGQGAVVALGAHGLLVAALAFGVSWRASEPTPASAELWAAVPQIAAPAPVEPPPPPPAPPRESPRPAPAPPPPPPQALQRDADIAIERAKRERQQREQEAREREREKAELAKAEREKLERQRELKAEREKAEREKAEREKAEKERLAKAKAEQQERERRQKADEARLAQQREENLKRILGQAGATGGPTATGTSARDAGPSASYAGRIVAAIRPNIVSINEFEGNPEAIVAVRAAPDGTILSRRLIRGSGDKGWDEEVLRAIDRTARLPRDENGRVPPDIELRMRPKLAG